MRNYKPVSIVDGISWTTFAFSTEKTAKTVSRNYLKNGYRTNRNGRFVSVQKYQFYGDVNLLERGYIA